MQDYIKKKRKNNVDPIRQTSRQITERQCRNELQSLMQRSNEMQRRIEAIKRKLTQASYLRIEQIDNSQRSLLVKPPMQEPSRQIVISDGNTQISNPIIQKDIQLGVTQKMVNEGGSDPIGRKSGTAVNDKLSSTGKRALRKRQIK